jgi:hypothetical protein
MLAWSTACACCSAHPAPRQPYTTLPWYRASRLVCNG